MGGSAYSDDIYRSRKSSTTAAGTGMFTHTHAVHTGSVRAGVHETLDPSKPNKAGKLIRESIDSDVHPDSVAIAVMFDVTGSMAGVPRTFIEKMPKLMAALVKKGYIEHPHILFGAIGDAYSDEAPLQVGQFEGGNEMDAALGNIYLEGNGGGQNKESYDLALYYMAHHTHLDCFEKRGKKGYLFILGDEMFYPEVNRGQVERLIGDKLEADIPFKQVLEEAQKKFEVFWIMPGGTSHWGDASVEGPVKALFGERHLKLENPDDVCELVVSAIGATEGYDIHDITGTLRDMGASKSAIASVTSAIVPYSNTTTLTRKSAAVEGTLATSDGEDETKRL